MDVHNERRSRRPHYMDSDSIVLICRSHDRGTTPMLALCRRHVMHHIADVRPVRTRLLVHRLAVDHAAPFPVTGASVAARSTESLSSPQPHPRSTRIPSSVCQSSKSDDIFEGL